MLERNRKFENNISERELRRQAVGRRNWLFVGSDDAAHVNGAHTAPLARCRMVRVEPWEDLSDPFCASRPRAGAWPTRLARWSAQRSWPCSPRTPTSPPLHERWAG